MLLSKGLLPANKEATLQDHNVNTESSSPLSMAQTYKVRPIDNGSEQVEQHSPAAIAGRTSNKEKVFNCKIGFVTKLRIRTLSVFRKKNKPKTNVNRDTKSYGDLHSTSQDSDGFSIQSDDPVPIVPRIEKHHFRGKGQPPVEFIMQYLGGYS